MGGTVAKILIADTVVAIVIVKLETLTFKHTHRRVNVRQRGSSSDNTHTRRFCYIILKYRAWNSICAATHLSAVRFCGVIQNGFRTDCHRWSVSSGSPNVPVRYGKSDTEIFSATLRIFKLFENIA